MKFFPGNIDQYIPLDVNTGRNIKGEPRTGNERNKHSANK